MEREIAQSKFPAGGSAPQPSWWERLRHPEDNLGVLEPAYRQSVLKADLEQLRVMVYIYIAAIIIYIVNDYQLFGLTPAFPLLMLVRTVMIANVVIMLHSAASARSFDVMDRIICISCILAMFLHLYIIYSRPASLAYIDLLIILVIYLVIPNRFYYRLIPAMVFSLGDLVFFLLLRSGSDPGSINLFALGAALMLGNFTGIVVSLRLYAYRRRQFKAQYDERLARQEIEQLAAQLREANEFLDQKVRERTAELAQANTALVKAHQQLQELDHLKSNFLGVVTHELRSPFVNISMSLQLIERQGLERLATEQREQFEQLNGNVQSAKVMTEWERPVGQSHDRQPGQIRHVLEQAG